MMKTQKMSLLVFALPVVALGLALLVNQIDFVKQGENGLVDWRFRSRAQNDPPADPAILVVGISETGISEIGRWPWERSHHGDLLQLLSLRPPAAIAFDILFSEPSRDAVQDTALANGLAAHPGAITAASAGSSDGNTSVHTGGNIGATVPLPYITGDISSVTGNDAALLPVAELRDQSKTGFVNVEPSAIDGVRRKVPMIVRVGESVYPSLSLQALMSSRGVEPDEVEVTLGESIEVPADDKVYSIPIDESGKMWINYRGTNTGGGNDIFSGAGSITWYGLFQFLAAYYNGGDLQDEWFTEYETPDGVIVPVPAVKDQILFIGQTATSLTDLGETPLGPKTPLVNVHAQALNNILQNDYLKTVPFVLVLIGFLAIAFLTIIITRKAPIWLAVTVPMLVLTGFVALAWYLFHTKSLHIAMVWPIFGYITSQGGLVMYRWIHEAKSRSRIKEMFSTCVSPDVVDQLIESGEMPTLGGEEIEITAFFSDIESFSGFSEVLSPSELITLMNDYLSEMADILKYEGSGTVDKYIGDAIVAMFGAPVAFDNHAYQACLSAIKMQEKQAQLCERWRSSGEWPEVVCRMKTRIGINSGQGVVGYMGSTDRMNYTMMGDTVNLAARTESGAKSYGVYTMVTAETRAKAIGTKDDLVFRYLDKIIVKGRTRPESMYELIGFQSNLPEKTGECLSIFADGIEKYQARDWDGAKACFEASALNEPFQPTDSGVKLNPSILYIDRCQKMKANPPGENWDGVYRMTTK